MSKTQNTIRQTPNAERRTQNAERQTPNAKLRTLTIEIPFPNPFVFNKKLLSLRPLLKKHFYLLLT